jgi:hypothetical protein
MVEKVQNIQPVRGKPFSCMWFKDSDIDEQVITDEEKRIECR